MKNKTLRLCYLHKTIKWDYTFFYFTGRIDGFSSVTNLYISSLQQQLFSAL